MAVDAPLMAIRRGFMASGSFRTNSILSKPLSKALPVGNLIWLAVDRESGDAVVE
jgi:hypothetical protein